MVKNNKGITLIALIITIIILLILAAVSWGAIVGPNGLINRVQGGREAHEAGEAEQENRMQGIEGVLNSVEDKVNNGGSQGNLASDEIPIYTQEQLAKICAQNSEVVNINGKDYTFTPNAKYRLMNDITLTGEWRSLGLGALPNTGWKLIKFSGTFDGNNKTINNMLITPISSTYTTVEKR